MGEKWESSLTREDVCWVNYKIDWMGLNLGL